jgi:hypothetical protein
MDMGRSTWLRDLILGLLIWLRDLLHDLVFGVLAITLAVLVFWPIIMVSSGVSTRLFQKRGRLRGRYAPSIVFGLLALSLFGTYAATIPWPNDHQFPAISVVYMIVAVSMACCTIVVVAAVLPARGRSGPSRIRHKWLVRMLRTLEVVSCVVFLPVAIAEIVFFVRRGEVLDLVRGPLTIVISYFVLALIVGSLMAGADRLESQSYSFYTYRTSNEVLFVRPFAGEFTVPFNEGSTFENFFGRAMNQTIGELIALGNPTDRLAFEDASKRIYVADSEWRGAFRKLAEGCRCIVGFSLNSPNTMWELQHTEVERSEFGWLITVGVPT